jgi:fucose 4-O-acetylase-like acetyltransferase
MFYGVILFATLHADVLYRIRGFERKIDTTVAANYIFMTTVVIMLSLVIFSSSQSDLGEFFYRLLAAVGIVDATMTMTAIIMHKMYLQKHPTLVAQAGQATTAQSKNLLHNPLVVLLIIFLAFQVIGSIFALILRGF